MNRFYNIYQVYEIKDMFSSKPSSIPLCNIHAKQLKQRIKGLSVYYMYKGNKTNEDCYWCRSPQDFEKLMQVLMI